MTPGNLNTKVLSKVIPFAIAVLMVAGAWNSSAHITGMLFDLPLQGVDTGGKDTLKYPIKDNKIAGEKSNSVDFKDPGVVKKEVEYDPETGMYVVREKVNGRDVRAPRYISFEDYARYEAEKGKKDYWKQKSNAGDILNTQSIVPKLYVGGEVFDRIFGGSSVNIRPQGSAELTFGVRHSRNNNSQLTERQQRNTDFDFDQRIQMNVVGNIGDKLKLTTNYNTESTFDFENQIKIEYTGYDDEIIKKIEAGNVSLPINGSLITGSQSLFGLKTQMQFGRLMVTTVLSQQKSEQKEINIKNGAQSQEFEVQADEYDANRHFFLSHFFRDRYEQSLRSLPIVNSGVNITQVEVWITNENFSTDVDTRDIIALIDLGESERIYNPDKVTNDPNFNIPDNRSNNVLNVIPGAARESNSTSIDEFFTDKDNYAKLNAKKLKETEFAFNTQLGYISLNRSLNTDQTLAVSYRFSYQGKEYTVGELSTENQPTEPPKVLFVKLLKNQNVKTKLPSWDLMMKNIYSFGGYNVGREDFQLDVTYLDEELGSKVTYLTEGEGIKLRPLIQVLGLDNLNNNQQQRPDGIFDFVPGITVDQNRGRIIFPVLEPFGDYLESLIPGQTEIIDKLVYKELYDSTKFAAQQFPEKNKFFLSGNYKSTVSSEFSLSAINIPKGAVVVTAGTTPLVEGRDFTVDYNLGRVKIINEGILASGADIKIKVESSALFGLQQKTFIGTRFDYTVSDKLTLGGTMLNLSERPFTPKVNVGEEPISNSIYGLDATYKTDSRYLTSLVDKIPLIQTKEMSTLTATAEYAHLVPGHARALNTETSTGGVAYLDDFEGSKSTIDLRNPFSWSISSTPSLFPESSAINSLDAGKNRAKLSFYRIDPLFYSNTTINPSHLRNDDETLSNHYVREVLEQEVFPNRPTATGAPNLLQTIDLAYFPQERGPYNFNTERVKSDGTLDNPELSWGGMTRPIETNDFEALNVEFIEFWVLDPFIYNQNSRGGSLYLNIGNVSEDILSDGRYSFENGLPRTEFVDKVDTSAYGRVPSVRPLTNSFDNDPNSRKFQDIGLDGLNDDDEKSFFNDSYLEPLRAKHGANSVAVQNAEADPAGDNYHYFLGSDLDNTKSGIVDRYKRVNNFDKNSPTTDQSRVLTGIENTASTNLPSTEDLNRNNNLDQDESYFQYRIDISPETLNESNPLITDRVRAEKKLANGNTETVNWYQFKIPLSAFDDRINDIPDFKSVRFMRMFLTSFNEPVILRFARLQLVRGEWRKYNANIQVPGEAIPDEGGISGSFDVTTINIEENGNREPIPYVVPPGIEREVDFSNFRGNTFQNEQSLVLTACEMNDGDGRAAYKNLNFDFRSYKKLEMYIHAEDHVNGGSLKDDDISAFIRIGSDYSRNYYEIEIPLKVTLPGTSNPNEIWPDANKIELDLALVQEAKQRRNRSGASNNQPYPFYSGKYKITVLGSPDLSQVRTVMVGIRNPKLTAADDGQPKCGEVWFNEFRLSEFDEQGGWAATGRVSTKLADFANVTFSGRKETVGFGSISDKLNERNRDDLLQYDASGNFSMGKFFPEKTGVKVPMFVGYSEKITRPQYSPTNPDLILNEVLDDFQGEERDSVKKITETFESRKSINFTNVRKDKIGGGKSRIYDVENLNTSYAYTETFKRNFKVESDLTKTYNAGLGYNFNIKPKEIKPFEEVIQNRNLRIIKDFNFSYLPTSIKWNVSVNRKFRISRLRTITDIPIPNPEFFDKDFTLNRAYGFTYKPFKAVNVDFNASYNGIIEEPGGRIDTEEKRQQVINEIKGSGTTLNYNHNTNISYQVPINKIPYFEWLSATTSYGSNYTWTAAPLAVDSFGHTIQNSRNLNLNSSANMSALYNKSKYLRDLNRRGGRKNNRGRYVNPRLSGLNKIGQTDKKEDSEKAEEDSVEKVNYAKIVLDNTVKLLTSLKTLSGTYSKTNGQRLPGIETRHRPGVLGYDNNYQAPGFGFLFGQQNNFGAEKTKFPFYAAQEGWLVKTNTFSNPYQTDETVNLNLRANLEPIRDLRVDLTAQRMMSENRQSFFAYNESLDAYEDLTPNISGSYSRSFIMINTAFSKLDTSTNQSPEIQQLLDNSEIIRQRLIAQNPNSPSVPDSFGTQGYGNSQQEVLMYSFLSAYSGKSAGGVELNPFPAIPLPGWRVSYNGLSKIDFFKQYFNSVSLNHGYSSTQRINGYVKIREFDEGHTNSDSLDFSGNFIPEYQVNQMSLQEQFSPLIGINVTTKTNITISMDYKKTRNLNLSFGNNQINEQRSNEVSLTMGYRTSGLQLPFGFGGAEPLLLKNDINFRFTMSIRDNKTIVHRLALGDATASSGSRIFTFRPEIDYVVNERFNINLFFERSSTTPFTSNSFKNSISYGGVKIRFTLSQ